MTDHNTNQADAEVVHEFRPLPDRTPAEQAKVLTAIVHQMSQTNFEIRLELNDLKEQNIELMKELLYLRGVVDAKSMEDYRNLMKN